MPKILVVEDNEVSRDMLCRRMKRRGYRVIAAADGEQGYSLARSEMPELTLMDISLPEMDGWEVINLLKAKEATRHIPIIVVTVHALVNDRAKALEVGCDGCHIKPIDFARLTDKIDLLLKKRPA
jgi:two-component system, cell cycle response regulator DivK